MFFMQDHNENNLTIDMELAEFGSIDSIVRSGAIVFESSWARWIVDSLHGLAEIGNRGLVHCDIKPANILITAQFRAKICDFGLSRIPNGHHSNEMAGTYEYAAPEVLFRRRPAPTASRNLDTWSLGIAFYQAISGRLPWAQLDEYNDDIERKMAIKIGHAKILTIGCPQLIAQNFPISSELQKFITLGLLNYDHNTRPSPELICNNSYIDQLRGRLFPVLVPKFYSTDARPEYTPLRDPFELRTEVLNLSQQLASTYTRQVMLENEKRNLAAEIHRCCDQRDFARHEKEDAIRERDLAIQLSNTATEKSASMQLTVDVAYGRALQQSRSISQLNFELEEAKHLLTDRNLSLEEVRKELSSKQLELGTRTSELESTKSSQLLIL